MRKGEATKLAILKHAFETATRVGLEGVTIGALASDLKLSKAGLHGHFGTKESLQVQVVDYAAERFTQQVITPALQAAPGAPRIQAVFENWVGWYLKNPRLYGCFFVGNSTELDDRPGTVRDRFVSALRQMMLMIADAVRAGISAGHFKAEVDPEQFAYELYGIILAHHNAERLLKDPNALDKAKSAFRSLIQKSLPNQHSR